MASELQIELTQNKVALVDEEDFEWVNQWKWYAVKSKNGIFYAARSERVAGKQRRVFLHRLLLGLEHGDPVQCDHRNLDGLDNRRANLRRATQRENNLNRRKFKRNRSGYTGVCWNSQYGRWQANAIVDGHWKILGYFANKDDAIAARRRAEQRHYGDFAFAADQRSAP